MADFVKLDDEALDGVSGGMLNWGAGVVSPEDDPSAVYHYSSFSACMNYISANWGGGTQNEDTLKMLEAAGLVWKA